MIGDVPGIVLPRLRIGVAIGVITELREDPGAEDHTETRLAGEDLSVPVTAKTLGHHHPERVDLSHQGGDDPDLRDNDRRERVLHCGALPQRGCAQDGLEVLDALVDLAPLRPAHRRHDPRLGQPRGHIGVRRRSEQLEGLGCIEVLKCLQGSGKVLPQGAAQAQQVARAIPDQRLVRAGNQLQRLTVIGVTSHRAVVRTVQANNLSQDVSVPGVAVRPRRRVPLPVSGGRHRVDREHLVARRDQRRDPPPTFGLDPDLHPARDLVRIQLGPLRRHRRGDQFVQLAEPLNAFG